MKIWGPRATIALIAMTSLVACGNDDDGDSSELASAGTPENAIEGYTAGWADSDPEAACEYATDAIGDEEAGFRTCEEWIESTGSTIGAGQFSEISEIEVTEESENEATATVIASGEVIDDDTYEFELVNEDGWKVDRFIDVPEPTP